MSLSSQPSVDYVALARSAVSQRRDGNAPTGSTSDAATKASEATKAPEGSLLCVVVDGIEPRQGPIRRESWLVIARPDYCIRADLASLDRVVPALAEARRAGDRRAVERFEDELGDLLERLEVCGARVRVEGMR